MWQFLGVTVCVSIITAYIEVALVKGVQLQSVWVSHTCAKSISGRIMQKVLGFNRGGGESYSARVLMGVNSAREDGSG